MSGHRLRRLGLLASVCVGLGGGCRWAREVTWDLSPRENEPREPAREYLEQDASDRKSVAAQRAQNEAEFNARSRSGR